METNRLPAAIKGQADGRSPSRERAWPDENGARSIRSEFIDRLCVTVRCIEIARAIESQAQGLRPASRNGAEDDPLSVWV